jgi:hypothetical protein
VEQNITIEIMDSWTLRLINRSERVSKAAAAAHKLYKSSATQDHFGSDGRRSKNTSRSKLESETPTFSAEAEKNKRCTQTHMIQLTGQELNEAGGKDRVSSDADIAPGDPIFVLWTNRIWYPATCISTDHQNVEFRWLDPGNYDETGTTDLSQVRRRIVGSYEIAAGTRIYVKWSEDSNWYPATFISKHADSVHFEWEDCGDFDATGTVDSSHIRIMVDEAEATKMNPFLLPCEDAVRRYIKDISTSHRQEPSFSASSRSKPIINHALIALVLCL